MWFPCRIQRILGSLLVLVFVPLSSGALLQPQDPRRDEIQSDSETHRPLRIMSIIRTGRSISRPVSFRPQHRNHGSYPS